MLQSLSSLAKTSFASWLPKHHNSDPIRSSEIIIGLEGFVILRKLSAKGRAGLFICIGRTINIDRLATPRYLESTKVRSRSKHVDIQTKHYEHRGSIEGRPNQ